MFTLPIARAKENTATKPSGDLDALGSRLTAGGSSVRSAHLLQESSENHRGLQPTGRDPRAWKESPRDFGAIPVFPPGTVDSRIFEYPVFSPRFQSPGTLGVVKAVDDARIENGTTALPGPAAFCDAMVRGQVRDDAAAGRSAQLLQADAVAFGDQILLRGGRTSGNKYGNALLAHELTHVAHQLETGRAYPQRSVGGDVLTVQFTREMAEAMTAAELDQQMEILRAHLQAAPDDDGAKQNLAVLEGVAYTRQQAPQQGSPAAANAAKPQASPGNVMAQGAPQGEEEHGRLWWLLHKVGLTMTKHERGDLLRKGWGRQSGVVISDDDGNPINVEELSDDEIIALDKQLRGRPIGHTPPAAGIAAAVTWPLACDAAGKIHGELPNAADAQKKINSMNKEELEQSAEELEKSIANRKAEQLRLGENSPKGPVHRARIGEEEGLLRAIRKKLSGS